MLEATLPKLLECTKLLGSCDVAPTRLPCLCRVRSIILDLPRYHRSSTVGAKPSIRTTASLAPTAFVFETRRRYQMLVLQRHDPKARSQFFLTLHRCILLLEVLGEPWMSTHRGLACPSFYFYLAMSMNFSIF